MVGFELAISNDKRFAYIDFNSRPTSISTLEIAEFLNREGVRYGILEKNIEEFCRNYPEVTWPLLVAEGQKPLDGRDGFINSEFRKVNKGNNENELVFNFREVLDIPSVNKGDLLFSVIQPTIGKAGIDVFGNEIAQSKGKPYHVRLGKNVELINSSIYSLMDGQVSCQGNLINVHPVFEVNGDLSMRTGNINFIGNVIIRGNIPTGYSIRAGGDIKISGLVEGVELYSNGSIYISGGVVGANRCKIVADFDLYTSYINQAHVEVGNNIEVSSAIIHSNCNAKEKVFCQHGNIIGGTISVGKELIAREIGNGANVRTEVFLGIKDDYSEQLKQEKLQQIELDLSKLTMIANKLVEKYKNSGTLSQNELLILKRYKVTENQLKQELLVINNDYVQTTPESNDILPPPRISILHQLYPNVHFYCGKYKRINNQTHLNVKVELTHKEIVISPLS